MSALRAFRVGVVGARRAHNGVGAWLAAFLHAAGAKVVAVAGRTALSAAEAAKALEARHGITAAPFDDVREMIAASALDALVVASPDPTHEDCLGAALEAGLHVLCEKPLLEPTPGFEARGARVLDAFAARSLCLAVNCQWRFALPAYMRLFPRVSPRSARRFEMELAPSEPGPGMLAQAMPHPLALLDHLFPAADPGLREVAVEQPSPQDAVVRFTHPGRGGVACEVRLRCHPSPPRPAAFAFDGHWARRAIREPGYRLSLVAGEEGGREVPLPDPMEALVRHFVAAVRKGPPFPPDPTVRAGLVHLGDLARAWPREGGR